MKIAFILRNFGGVGGTEKYSGDLASWLTRSGHQVHVHSANLHLLTVSRAGVVPHPMALAGRGWTAERDFVRLADQIPRDRYDLVQGFGRSTHHDVFRAGGGAHATWLKASGTTLFRRLRASLSFYERWCLKVDHEAASKARIVFCNSEMAAADVRRVHQLAEERVRVIRNGVDGQRFRPSAQRRQAARAHWGVPDGGRVALFLGSGFHRKGLETAVRAFAKSARSKDRLVVMGRDSQAERRLQQARQVLGDRLVASGPVQDPEAWLPGADATLLPTRYDAAANTTLEALACGVPAVTSRKDGNHEIVPCVDWVVADPDDATAFGRALDAAWSAGEAASMTCRTVAEEWTVNRNGAAVEALYNEVAGV